MPGQLAKRTPEDVLELEILLTRSADEGDLDEVRRLLGLGADPDGISGTKARRYAYAAGRQAGRLGIYEPATPLIALLLRNYDSQTREYLAKYPAAVYADLTRLLLAAGADPDVQGGMGGFALQEAIELGSVEVVRLLIEAGANVDLTRAHFTQIDIHRGDPPTALASAIQGGHHEIISLLLEAEANLYEADWGLNALHRCAYEHDPVAMALVLEALEQYGSAEAEMLSGALGELIDAWPTRSWKPAILLRAQADWGECFQMLVERGASLQYAHDIISDYHIKQVELPFFHEWLANAGQQGLDVRPSDYSPDWPSMDELLWDEDIEPLRKALGQGMDPNRRTAAFGHEWPHAVFEIFYESDGAEAFERLRLLIQAGLDPAVRDSQGQTLMHRAASDANHEALRYLASKGADINAQDDDGFSPLTHAGGANRQELEATEQVIRELGGKHGQPGSGRHATVAERTQQAIELDPRLEGLLSPVKKRAIFEWLVDQRRYVRPVAYGTMHNIQAFKIGRVFKHAMPQGPPIFIVFDQDKDARGRSAFICFRGDGAMLPRREGEVWRMRPEDVVDLDGDGAVELLIDMTLRDEKTKLGGLRIVSPTKQAYDGVDWVVLYPHRDEPGAFAWQVDEMDPYRKTHFVEFGPLGGKGQPLWMSWRLTYNDVWLSKIESSDYGLFSDIGVQPCMLIQDNPEEERLSEAAEALAERLYPKRYE